MRMTRFSVAAALAAVACAGVTVRLGQRHGGADSAAAQAWAGGPVPGPPAASGPLGPSSGGIRRGEGAGPGALAWRPVGLATLRAEVTDPPEHLGAWAALRGRALRTQDAQAQFQAETTSDRAILRSFELLESGLLLDGSVAAQAKREFAIEHLRTAVAMADADRREELAGRAALYVRGCADRTAGLGRQLRGYARADCAGVAEILLSYAPQAAAALGHEAQPLLQRILFAGRELQATHRQL